MDTDDLEPPKEKAKIKDLEVMSVEALGDYISKLEKEIERAQLAIRLKGTAKNSAESIFVS
jgi:uncharacterized small protein (DUF1192 family)